MKIGLNGTCFNSRPSGAKQRFIGIYGELIRRLVDIEFVVYEPVDCRVGSWFDGAPNVSIRTTLLPSEDRAKRFFGGLSYWNSALLREDFDFFEGFNLPLVKARTGRTLLTIHDVRSLHADWGGFGRMAYKLLHRMSLDKADQVIVVSRSMKKEILSIFPGLSISVIHNGLDARGYDRISETDLQVVRREYALPEEFILAVGHLEKRKNYLRLLDAIALLRDQRRACFLLIVGVDSGERRVIENRIESAKLSGSVKILSALTDHEVRCVYKLCSLFVFPSAYEGFGIPILEAMAAKCPMVLSDIPVFKEITQDEGVYFSHSDTESMAFAIEKVLSSSSERTRLVEYGNERIKAFSFQRQAEQMECLYRELA